MPTICDGLLDYSRAWALPTVKLFTGNTVRRGDDGLVMGAGAALAVSKAWPRVPHLLYPKPGQHLAWAEIQPGQWIGWFQTKRHWRERSCLKLIASSAGELARVAQSRPGMTFELNAPGIGAGGLKWSSVVGVISLLPSNVYIFKA
jgi:hypothetical protein